MKRFLSWRHVETRVSVMLLAVITVCLCCFLFARSGKAVGVMSAPQILPQQGQTPAVRQPNIEIPPVNLHPWVTFRCQGTGISENFGNCVASAGDVNGDGFADILIGNKRRLRPDFVKLYFGGFSMNSTPGVNFTDPAPDPSGGTSAFGWSVASLGDINGDGYDDVIVGADGQRKGGFGMVGRAYIYFGGSEMDTSPDIVLEGVAAGDSFGYSVAGAGDVNGDGYPDVLIGGGLAGPDTTGKAWLFWGGPDMDTAPDMIFYGENPNDEFGHSVSGAGDVNGDGYADIIIGAPGFGGQGKIYIYFGGPEMDATSDFVQTGSAGDFLLGTSVCGAGDLNGDGYDDVAFSAPMSLNWSGRVYILYGGQQMSIDHELMIPGEADCDFGISVAKAGDTNGDGYDDLIIGGDFYGDIEGKIYLYLGGPSMDAAADAILYFPGSVMLGESVSGAGDVNGDGLDDIIFGEPGSYGRTGCTGAAHIVLGNAFQPIIHLAGFIVEKLSDTVTRLKIMALVASARENRSISGVELYYLGLSTRIMLNDEGVSGDDIADDGIYTYECTFTQSDQSPAQYLLEIVARDITGSASAVWPYVTVNNDASSTRNKHHAFDSRRLASVIVDRGDLTTQPNGSNAPSILFWGTDSSNLSASRGGLLSLYCIADDPDGVQDIARIEIAYQGMPTGILMQLDDAASEFFPYCGLYTFQILINQPLTAGDYLLTATAIDMEGNESEPAPYLYL